MKKFLCVLLLVLTVFYFLDARISAAMVTIPSWATTFNCSDWDSNINGGSMNCDGLGPAAGSSCGDGSLADQITTAANYPLGGGGKGLRHYIGSGQNINGMSINIQFPSAVPEFWFRWYMRYPAGFKWQFLGYQKVIYPSGSQIIDMEGNKWSLYNGTSQLTYYSPDGIGWFCIWAGKCTPGEDDTLSSDGSWHEFEVHLKTGNPGGFEIWRDGNRLASTLNINNGGGSATYFGLLTNQNNPNVGTTCVPVDVDDFAISTTGYIGPLNPQTPSSPTNLSIQ